jgi:hypothetical protein
MNTRKSAVKWAGASALSVLLVSTSAFAAAPRHNRNQNGTDGQAAQTRVQTAQRGTNGGRAGNQQWNGQQQANPAPAIVQPANDSQYRNHSGSQTPPVVAQNANAQRQNQYGSRTSPAASNQSWGNTNQARGRADQSNVYRENQRVNVSGRVQSFNRERNGYRVYLDSGNYWIPEARFGNRARDLRVGISLSFGGIFRGGVFGIDAVSWGASSGYDQGYVRGIVQQVDYRSDTMTLLDASTGRLFEVDMRDLGNASLGRGDSVTLSGQWVQGNVFAAYRIDSVNRG